MTNVALMVRLEAKKGKEAEVERFLQNGLQQVENEHDTVTWFALRLNPTTFGIFDTFPDNQARESHLTGEFAKALKKRTAELFTQPPVIEKVDVLRYKITEMAHH